MIHLFRTLNTSRDVEHAVIQLHQCAEPLARLVGRKPELFLEAKVHDDRLGMDIDIENALRQIEMMLVNVQCALHNHRARKHGVLDGAEMDPA